MLKDPNDRPYAEVHDDALISTIDLLIYNLKDYPNFEYVKSGLLAWRNELINKKEEEDS